MADTVVRCEGVSKKYGTIAALDRVDLEVHAGTFVGLLGPNGAGKTTLLNLLTGLRRPTTGRVELFGGPPDDSRSRRYLGVTPQQTGFPGTLRTKELIDFAAQHYTSPLPTGEVLERFGLTGLERRAVGGLSGGQQRRLAVALAFVGQPRLVVLDEPTTGLDVQARTMLWDGIRQYSAEGGTVLLTSHYMEEVDALADRVVVLKAGQVVADDETQKVKATVSLHTVSFTAVSLPALDGVVAHEQVGDRHVLRTADPDQLIRDLVRAGVDYGGLDVRRPSLEEAFLALNNAPTEEALR